MDKNSLELIKTRRSVRKYQKKEVSDEIINDIIKVSMSSPSARCQMPWEFLVIKDKKKLELISENFANISMAKDCSFVIIYLMRTKDLLTPGMAVCDMSSIITIGLLAARSYDIGSCWCGLYPNESRMNLMKSLFNIKDETSSINNDKKNANCYLLSKMQ